MHREILIVILLSSCVLSTLADGTTASPSKLPTKASVTHTKEKLVTSQGAKGSHPVDPTYSGAPGQPPVTTPPKKKGAVPYDQDTPGEEKQQMVHAFSMPVITVIVFAVMAGIIGIILLIAFAVRRLWKKRN
ncbi:glycophorin-A isoform X1 [Erinaceus europaeus]|uniref:Glycophorin-A n=1 Tax=Erinaceus europaeus TaxID=9365 RepID=A0ABM3WEK5_ERIEU|nr:glycophorin-A isoform X1 [Erinaceus europaeus]